MKNPVGKPAWLEWISRQPLWLRGLIVVSAGALTIVILLLVLAPPGFSSENPSETSVGAFGTAMNLILSLGFIIVLIFVTLNLLSKLRGGSWIQQSRRLKIIETTSLSQRQNLHIIRIGRKTYLVGATDQSITLLTELDADAEIEEFAGDVPFDETLQDELKPEDNDLNRNA